MGGLSWRRHLAEQGTRGTGRANSKRGIYSSRLVLALLQTYLLHDHFSLSFPINLRLRALLRAPSCSSSCLPALDYVTKTELFPGVFKAQVRAVGSKLRLGLWVNSPPGLGKGSVEEPCPRLSLPSQHPLGCACRSSWSFP